MVTKNANEPSWVAAAISIPFISRTETTHAAAATPIVAVSAAGVATVLVLVMAAPPRLEPVLVPAPRGEVEEALCPHQGLCAAVVGGVGVVDNAVLKREDAHTLPLRPGLVDVSIVVVGAISLLLLGEGGTEVESEIAPKRRNPRESPAHLPLVVLELLQRGDRLTN
jgi:hypothetical protein